MEAYAECSHELINDLDLALEATSCDIHMIEYVLKK